MNPFSKHTILAAIALAFCSWQPAAHAAAPDKSAALFPDPVVATGTGFEIKRSQLDDAYLSYSASIAANGGRVQDEERDVLRSNLLQHLIINRILTQKATAEDKAKVRKLVDDGIEEARRTAPSPEMFDAQIRATGMTLDVVRARATEEQLCRRVLQRETTNGIVVTEAEAKKFYTDNSSKFQEPEEVRVSHILISTSDAITQAPLTHDQKAAKAKLANEIRARAMKGEDFGKLVKLYSEDPGSKDKGGEYKFPRGQMVPEFEAAAFGLKVNQISEVVETRFGYHIIKLLEKYPARHEPFSEVEDNIKSYLVEKEAEKTLPAYLARIKAEAHVKLITPDSASAAH